MEKLNLHSSWDAVREKIKEINLGITDSDLDLNDLDENEVIERLSKKLHKSAEEVKAWIESVSENKNIAG